MDRREMAADLLEKMQTLRRAGPQKQINEALRGEAFALHFIADHDGGVLPGEISREMAVSSARIAKALNALEHKGLITRQINPKDRRQVLVSVTPEGKALEETHRQAVLSEAVKLLDLLGDRDAREYLRITGRLVEITQEFICNK
ncbi:MAG: MarR family transcriptional regulator [Clostridiales bacterium]|nr:MarR family transcriptional regulator [Clostridiales bacterium]